MKPKKQWDHKWYTEEFLQRLKATAAVEMDGDLDSFTQMIWDSLNEDNKVSLFTRFIDLESGKAESRIINKNK